MRCTFCLTFDNTNNATCAVCGAPLPLSATSHADAKPLIAPTSSTRCLVTPPKRTNNETKLSHIVAIETACDVLATTFLRNTRRGETEIAALFDDGSALSWRFQNRDVSPIEERELLAPLRHAPTLAAFNDEIAWTAHDEILTMRSLPTCAISNDHTSSTRCSQFAFSTPVFRLATSTQSAHVAIATDDGQVYLLAFENDEIGILWSVDTLSGVTALAVSGDCAKIAIGNDSGHLALHNRHDARDCWTTDTQSLWVANAAFSPNANALAIVDCNGLLQIRAAQNSASLQTTTLGFAPDALCFLNDNRHLIAADEHQFCLVDSWTGHTVSQSLSTVDNSTKSVSVGVCSASEENLFAVCSAREIQLWRF